MRFTPLRIALIVLGLFVAIQLIPVWLWQTNPQAQSQPKWDSPATEALAKRACYDCHSNQTTWPLYSKIAPSSWLVTWDVVRARRELNFDSWTATAQRRDPSRLARSVDREVSSGDMPPSYYLLMHPDAKLTADEQQQLIKGLQATIQQQ